MRFAVVALAVLFAAPAFAQDAAPVASVNPDDVMGLLQQILSAAGAKNWLLLVPLACLALISVFRLWVCPKVSSLKWFLTDRGGALLSVLSAVVVAIVAAVATPGAHTVASVIVAVVTMLVANQSLFGLLKKLLSASGPDAAAAVATQAAAVGAASAVSSTVAAAAINEAATELKK